MYLTNGRTAFLYRGNVPVLEDSPLVGWSLIGVDYFAWLLIGKNLIRNNFGLFLRSRFEGYLHVLLGNLIILSLRNFEADFSLLV